MFPKKIFFLLAAAVLLMGCAAAEILPSRPIAPPVPEAEAPAPLPPPEVHYLKLAAVGDIMCHKLQYTAAYTPTGYDFRESFTAIKPVLAEADLVIGNLETTFSGPEKTYSEYPTFNTPDAFADALADAGVSIVTTANNHSLDRRFYGLSRTLDVLDRVGILHTGTFRNPEDARILMVERNQIRMAVMAYSYGTNGIPFDRGKEYALNLIDEGLIRADIRAARDMGAELIVVGLHFGQEYQQVPNDSQRALAAACFDEGADIVLGTHPHVVQAQVLAPVTDRYGVTKNRFVAYSLGNFVSAQRTEPRAAGVIAQLDIKKEHGVAEVQSAAFVPTWVDQSTGAGPKMFRVLPMDQALDDPAADALLTAQDLHRLKRAWEYVTGTLNAQ